MIRSFRHKGLRRLYEEDDRSKLPAELLRRIGSVLAALDATERIEDMNRPGLRLHALKGDLQGFWSVSVSGNWRIIFRFEDGDIFDVDLIDYH
jgi:proteic killer suppression protein